jgi:hypothetical protein
MRGVATNTYSCGEFFMMSSIGSRLLRFAAASGILASAFLFGSGMAPQAFGVAPASAQLTTVTCPKGTKAHVVLSQDGSTVFVYCY